MSQIQRRVSGRAALFQRVVVAALAGMLSLLAITASAEPPPKPAPLLSADHGVDWWFVFKFNTKSFPQCGGAVRQCSFGGEAQDYAFGQQFVFASSEKPALQKGGGCVGDGTTDPVGATFSQIYNGKYYYVVWNDQFYDDPEIEGCSKACSSPWGHSKGILAWNDSGEGVVMQVTTPSWPASGSSKHPRESDGNTLGCIEDDNVKVSQHFFGLRLNHSDVKKVLKALRNASVVTDPTNPQIVNSGGPEDIKSLVTKLGKKSDSTEASTYTLSKGVELISKPSELHVPPWQMVSSLLDGVGLRTATWWAKPQIPSSTAKTDIACWDDKLGDPGPVEIATTGQWDGTSFGLKGGPGPNNNHAKFGVSTGQHADLAIFGDMNQQGTLSGKNCGSSQNGRGGLFYVIKNAALSASLAKLISGDTAPMALPMKESKDQ